MSFELPDVRHLEGEGFAGQHHRHLQPVGADREHTDRTGSTSVAVGPRSILPGLPKRSWWTGWLMLLPGFEYHIPKRWHVLRKKR